MFTISTSLEDLKAATLVNIVDHKHVDHVVYAVYHVVHNVVLKCRHFKALGQL